MTPLRPQPPLRTVGPEDLGDLDPDIAHELGKGRDVIDERSGHEHVRYALPGSPGVPISFLTDRPRHRPIYSRTGRRILHMQDGVED